MFGYIQPYKPLLLVKDFQIYKDVYCSLCRQLGKEYGVFARFTLSYDCTFYALFNMAVKGTCPQFKKGRCAFNPLKQCNYCNGDKQALSLASALSVITVYHKLCDNIRDSGFCKRTLYRMLKPIASHWRKKAIKKYDYLDTIVSNMMAGQCLAEQDKNCTLDKSAMPTANMLKALMQNMAQDDLQKEIYGELGFYLGKWVYLMDAADDYTDDLQSGGFNPFVIRYKDCSITDSEQQLLINSVINQNAARMLSAYNLIEFKLFKDIIDNVMNIGIGQMQKRVIFDKDKEKIHRKGRLAD